MAKFRFPGFLLTWPRFEFCNLIYDEQQATILGNFSSSLFYHFIHVFICFKHKLVHNTVFSFSLFFHVVYIILFN